MQFFSFRIPQAGRQSEGWTLTDSRFLRRHSSRMLEVPVSASLEVGDGHSPLVRFAGTFWRFKIYGFCPSTFVNGQSVKILGIQGNRLLIEMEKCDEK